MPKRMLSPNAPAAKWLFNFSALCSEHKVVRLLFAQRFITIFNCRYHTSNHLSVCHKPTSLSSINCQSVDNCCISPNIKIKYNKILTYILRSIFLEIPHLELPRWWKTPRNTNGKGVNSNNWTNSIIIIIAVFNSCWFYFLIHLYYFVLNSILVIIVQDEIIIFILQWQHIPTNIAKLRNGGKEPFPAFRAEYTYLPICFDSAHVLYLSW
jgi:hypothetical protein